MCPNANDDLDKSYLLTVEWPIYVFDALPMMVVLGVASRWYVGKLDVKGEHHNLVSSDDREDTDNHYLRA